MKKKNLINSLFIAIPIFILFIISELNMYKVWLTTQFYKYYVFKQALWFFLGIIAMVIIVIFKPKILFKYSKYLYLFNIVLLILVLFLGKIVNGSRAWFDLGFISFQPSELMKFSLALFLSEKLSNLQNTGFKAEFKFILQALFFTLIPSLFVFLEPDTGAILIYLIILLGIILVYKIDKKWYFILGTILILFIALFGYLYLFNKDLLIRLIGTSFFYRVDRILTFVNNDSFQLDRALISIGCSSLFGTGKTIYIPEAPTDFIIALSIANFGIISFIAIIISFFILDVYFLWCLFKLKKIKNKMFYGAFIAMFLFAQVHNIGMNLGLLPIIGLPMPFLSYGGTNIIVYFIFLGVLLGIKKENN